MKNIFFILFSYLFLSCTNSKGNEDFIVFEANPKTDRVSMYWKNKDSQVLKTIDHLKTHVESNSETLIFAMNGGMFEADNSPKGLYIENFKILNEIDTLKGEGNFYLNPNGVFYLTKSNEAHLVETEKFNLNSDFKFATQSGPLLLQNGSINSIFKKDSKNLNIRNGVGILKNGNILLMMSKREINFYNFAMKFKELGCDQALYLDGFVSRTYLPEKNWIQKDGNFGVIIGITKPKK